MQDKSTLPLQVKNREEKSFREYQKRPRSEIRST